MQKMLVLSLMVAMCLTVGCNKNKTAREVRPVPMPPGSSTGGGAYGTYNTGEGNTAMSPASPTPINSEPMSVQGVQNQTNYVASAESPYIELPAVSVNQGGMVEPIVQPTGDMATYDAGATVAPSTYTFSDQPMEATPTPSYVPSAPAPVPTPAVASAVHVVSKVDTLWRIAKQYYGSGKRWTDIARANNISDPNRIYVGMKLTIPR